MPSPVPRGFCADNIAQYYDSKLAAFGPTPLGADWSCEPTQQLRFIQLLKACDMSRPASINDLGCGYGALTAFLSKRHPQWRVDYLGVDICHSMIAQARKLWREREGRKFQVGGRLPRQADYTVASGIFNVKLDHGPSTWRAYVKRTLAEIDAVSRVGFAVNFLRALPGQTSIPQLYRTHPRVWMEYCGREFRGTTRVVDNYGMTEFTLVITR